MLAAFNAIKTALLQSVCLAFPRDNAELSLATDASETHVGAVLQQLEPLSREWRPLGFFSAKLEKAQLSYSAFHRELFGVYAAIRHFRHHLEGRLFTIWTDHKPLTFALSRLSDSWTARQQRQLSYVAEFTNKIFFLIFFSQRFVYFIFLIQCTILCVGTTRPRIEPWSSGGSGVFFLILLRAFFFLLHHHLACSPPTLQISPPVFAAWQPHGSQRFSVRGQ